MEITVWPILVSLFVIVFALSALTTKQVLIWLKRKSILDIPNHRSSHTTPTPRGGGVAITPVILIALTVSSILFGGLSGWPIVIAAGLGLFFISWRDDRRSLSPSIRLILQLGAVIVGIAALPPSALLFQGLLPLWADRVLAVFLWLWFVNLYNFMDGIDGITGVQTASLGFGLGILAVLSGHPQFLPYGIVFAATALGFLVWNWHPAKIFLGDSGSVPLGYVLGWLLISAAAQGLWKEALILPLYYLADATITLLRRAMRKEKIWQAHREHFYQKAVQAGASHSQVVIGVILCNATLFQAALIAQQDDLWIGFGIAIAIVAAFIIVLSRRARIKG